MRLLVSARAADEVRAALDGGADIIDAKDPTAGALGAVKPDVLASLLLAVPCMTPVSIALGEAGTPSEAARAVRDARLPAAHATRFIKLAVRAGTAPAQLPLILGAAAAAARAHPGHPSFVAVAYADSLTASKAVEELAAFADCAAAAGAAGVLADTGHKHGPGLLDCIALDALTSWVAHAKGLGLLAALAGRIGLRELPALLTSGADVVGVRGAACIGGRTGRTDADLVRRLKAALAPAAPAAARARGLAAKSQGWLGV